MSKFYFDWFYMCYTNEPPTANDAHIDMALSRGMLTQAEYDAIKATRQPEPIPEPIVETPPEVEEPTTEEPTEEPPTTEA